jgi:hypothetical protein
MCKAILGFLPCTIIVAGDRREPSWTNGAWQIYLIADARPQCEVAAAVAWRQLKSRGGAYL